MNNLETLYREDGAFRVEAIKRAADFIGTTSLEFAEEWITSEPEPTQLKDLFGIMRSSTDEEREAYEKMMDKHAIDTGVNMFDLPTDPGEAGLEGVKAFIAEHDSWEKLDSDIDYWLGKWSGLSVRIVEIKAEVRKWLDRAARIRGREIGFQMESWAKRVDDQSREIERLKAERDNLAADLAECMELNDKLSDEREKWRGTCGMMMDKAHEIQRIMADMEAK